MRTLVVGLALATLLAAAGCGDQAAILDARLRSLPGLPSPDASLDPSHLRLGKIIYGCGRWWVRPDSVLVLVDVRFLGTPDFPRDHPSESDLQAAEALGFTPLFIFQFPMARGWIPTYQVEALYATHVIWSVSSVPDPRRFDLGVMVWYSRPVTAQDSLDFVALGGRVTLMRPDSHWLAGDLPNASATVLRSRGLDVDDDNIGCLGASLARAPGRARAGR